MDFRNIRHLREILVTDIHGKTQSTMQYSTESISRFRPKFVDVPFKDQASARELYLRLGGRRREGLRIGIQVIVDIAPTGALAT